MSNSRFLVAVHILAGLTIVKMLGREESITSDRVAWSVNTNPVVVRRILGQLRKAGLVESTAGASGGSMIKVDPKEITLFDIFMAVENGHPFLFQSHSPNPACPVGANVFSAVKPTLSHARLALKKELQRATIDDIARQILVLSGRREYLPQMQEKAELNI